MNNLSDAARFMRILIRRQKGHQYLQPSGEWSENRETARDFYNSTVAYWCAKAQHLRGVEVLMAFEDPQWDFVPMTL